MKSIGIIVGIVLAMSSITYAESVGVFYNSSYNDTGSGSGDEAGEIARSVNFLGHTANLFSGTTGGAWGAAAAANDVLLFPEPERASTSRINLLTSRIRTVVRNFVASGGRLIVIGDYTDNDEHTARFLNRIFGYNLSERREEYRSYRTSAAAGTLFAGGPSSLPSNNGTAALRNLPSSATSVYRRSSDNTVVQFDYGNGEIVYLGWDWFEARPGPGQDGGWLGILDMAIKGAGASTGGPVPEPGTLALLGAAAAGFVLVRRRRS